MGEKLRETIQIPKWMFGIILTILIGILAFNASFAGTKQEVNTHTKEIELLRKDKVDKETLNLVLEGIKDLKADIKDLKQNR